MLRLKIVWPCVLIVCALLVSGSGVAWSPRATAANAKNYLFTSFRGNGEDGLHLALSTDGLRWSAVGADRAFLKPEVGNSRLMRDPSIARAKDGTFHLVWTTGWTDLTIGYASSKDLLTWSTQRAIPVMAHERSARNAWAPELFFDDKRAEWLIFWASTIPGRFVETDQSGNNGLNHRIYLTRTRDFKEFAPTELFYDPGFNSIDATIIKAGSRFVMIFKDERQNPVKKNLRLATASSASGPYGEVSEPFTRDWVEGPSAIRIGSEWVVYYDRYRERRYGAVKSKDLRSWTDISDKLSDR